MRDFLAARREPERGCQATLSPWDEAHAIMELSVARGLERRTIEKVETIGIDEKAFRKGHQYLPLVSDNEGSRVLYFAEERKESSVDGFGPRSPMRKRRRSRQSRWTCGNPTSTRCVPTSRELMRRSFSISFISPRIFEKPWTLYVAKRIGPYAEKGDDRLVGTKYDWLTNPTRFTRSEWTEFARLRQSDLKDGPSMGA